MADGVVAGGLVGPGLSVRETPVATSRPTSGTSRPRQEAPCEALLLVLGYLPRTERRGNTEQQDPGFHGLLLRPAASRPGLPLHNLPDHRSPRDAVSFPATPTPRAGPSATPGE